MLKRSSLVLGIIALLGAGIVSIAPASRGLAQAGLRIGGPSANFGVFTLLGGFMPDPAQYNVTSGGNLDASTLGLAPNCRGFVTAQPDVIVRYQNPRSWIRFFVRAQGDTTLVINDAQGRWHCSDDEGGNLNPMVDISGPGGGQYDIWVGSYRAGQNITGTLHVTELTGNRP
ncbi:MAG: peptidase S1 [Deltaproteobacteria bacterium]|nr:peptidase S1 [Deltaproteobacteria bacterium]